MVIDDLETKGPAQSSPNCTPKAPALSAPHGAMPFASPVDHLAALVADLILFIPLVTLALSTIRREITMAQIAGETNRYVGFMIAAALVMFGGAVLYQTVFVALCGQTPGKRVLRLKVVSIWGEPISWSSAFLRAIFWCGGLACAGLPWLSIFSDARRRSLHDKVAETMVIVEDRKRAVSSPGPWEQSVVGGFRSALMVFGVLVAARLSTGFWNHQTITQRLLEGPPVASEVCEDVSAALPGWMGGPADSRVEIALSLYAAERIQDDCLEKEAVHGFLQDKDIESSYVAKSILHQDDEKISQRYQKKVCGNFPDGAGCRLLTWLQDKNNRDAVIPNANDPTFLKVWAIKANSDRHQNSAALSLLAAPAPHLELAYFYASNRLAALRDTNQNVLAQVQFRSVLDGLNRDERWQLSKDACLAETTLGCPSHASGCDTIAGLASSDPHLVAEAEPELATAMIHGARCGPDPVHALVALKTSFDDSEARASAEVALALAKADTKTAHRLAQSLADNDGTSIFSTGAWETFAKTSATPDQLHHAMEAWSDIDDDGSAWRSLGWQLAQAYLKFHKPEQTLRIGEKLIQSGFSPPELQKDMVIAAFEKGHTDEARSYLALFNASPGEDLTLTTGPLEVASRSPASVETRDEGDRDERFQKAITALREASAP